ncbi:MAG: hypothetical protein FWG73_07980 [Planctomycetaceae bacterium]|nr:hypothetical protein [Planctomycetaceae bacterium]
MKRHILRSLAVAVAIFALSCNVFAQPDSTLISKQNDGNGNLTHTMVLNGSEVFLWNAEIAEMLNCSPEQQNEFQQVLEKFWIQYPTENPRTRTQTTQLIDDMREEMNQVMTPEQRTQFGEMTFQLAGGLDALFLDDRTLEILELTAEQKDHVRQIAEERTKAYRIAMGEMRNNLRPDVREGNVFERMAQQREFALDVANSEQNKKFAEQIKALLTPEQRARGEKLTADAPALLDKMPLQDHVRENLRGLRVRDAERQEQSEPTAPAYVPGTGSWRPGDAIPERYRQERNTRGRFPRPADR